MQFLLDENANIRLIPFLKNKGHEAVRVPAGFSNGAVFSLAVKERRILITHDADFSLDPPVFDHSGVLLVKIPPRDFEDIKSSFEKLLSEKTSPNLFANRLFLLFKGRYEDFPYRAEEFPL